MTPVRPQLSRPAARGPVPAVPGMPEWLRLARLARMLSLFALGWLGIEAGVAIGAAVVAGSVALLGYGLDSGIEALASIVVIWRFTGTRPDAGGFGEAAQAAGGRVPVHPGAAAVEQDRPIRAGCSPGPPAGLGDWGSSRVSAGCGRSMTAGRSRRSGRAGRRSPGVPLGPGAPAACR
jgi:hypothetical protein